VSILNLPQHCRLEGLLTQLTHGERTGLGCEAFEAGACFTVGVDWVDDMHLAERAIFPALGTTIA